MPYVTALIECFRGQAWIYTQYVAIHGGFGETESDGEDRADSIGADPGEREQFRRVGGKLPAKQTWSQAKENIVSGR